jgi:hypothetical protein
METCRLIVYIVYWLIMEDYYLSDCLYNTLVMSIYMSHCIYVYIVHCLIMV